MSAVFVGYTEPLSPPGRQLNFNIDLLLRFCMFEYPLKKSTMTYLFDKSVKRKKMLMFPVTKEKLLQVQFNHKCLLLDRSKYNYIDCKDH